MFYAWPDVAAAAVLSGRAPHIVSAHALVPVGRQAKMRRRLPVLPGLVLHAERDPVLALVRHRRKVKTATIAYPPAAGGDEQPGLRNPSRFDVASHYDRRTRSTTSTSVRDRGASCQSPRRSLQEPGCSWPCSTARWQTSEERSPIATPTRL